MTLNAVATTGPLTDGGPLTISWTITQQLQSDEVVSKSTTHTTKQTNYISNYKATTTTSTLGNASLLGLLANSFNTKFPAGAQLATDEGQSVYVVDKTGTNVVLDISSVLSVNTTTTVISDSYSSTTILTKSGTTPQSITGSRTSTAFLQLTYDDSGMTTTDGTHTTFSFSGVSPTVGDVTDNIGHGSFSTLDGAGSGTIRGKQSLITQGAFNGSFPINLN